MQSLSSSIHTSLYAAANQAVIFICSVMITRVLGPEGRGEYALLSSTAMLFSLFLGFSLSAAIPYARGKMSFTDSGLRRIILHFSYLITAISAVVLIAGHAFGFVSYLLPARFQKEIIACVIVYVLLQTAYTNLVSLLRAREEFAKANRIEFAVQLGYCAALMAGIALAWTRFTPYAPLVCTCLAVAGAILYMLRSVSADTSEMSPRDEWLHLKYLFGFAFMCHVPSVLQFFNYRLDFYILSRLRPMESLGYYSLSATLAQTLWVIPVGFGNVIYPRLSNMNETEEDKEEIFRLIRIAVCLIAVAGGVAASVASWVIPFVFGAPFAASTMPFLYLLPGAVLFGLSILVAHCMTGVGRPGLYIPVAGVALVITVVLDLMWIPRHGADGAALATTCAYAAGALISAGWFCRRFHVSPWRAFVLRREDVSAAWALLHESWRKVRVRS